LDGGRLAVYAVAADGIGLDRVEADIDRVLAEVRENGVTQAELDRAKKAYMAEYIYESDNQSQLARRYGWGLVVGRTVKDIDEWPERISRVTPDEVKAVAAKYLDIRKSSTGTLIPTPLPSEQALRPGAGRRPVRGGRS
jgi:zinc protease